MKKLIEDEYGDYLSENEIQFVLDFYKFSQDRSKTIIMCNELRKAFYGKTFGRESKVNVRYINEELAKCVCLRLIGRNEDYFNTLPVELQDEAIGLYEDVLDENELKKQLLELLEIEPPHDKKNDHDSENGKTYKINSEDNSLLGRLRRFQKELNEESKEKK